MGNTNSRTLLLLTVLTVAAVFGLQVFLQLGEFLSACERGGDLSVLLLNVERAGHFEALVGPYSRYRVAHPGPIVFYFYAAFEFLLGNIATPMGAAMLAQVFLNLLFAIAAVLLVLKNADRSDAALLLLAIMLYMFEATKVPYFHYIWNPAVLLFPCAALLVSAAAISTRRSRAVIVFALAALVMCHHHIAGAAFVLGISFVTLCLTCMRRGWADFLTAPYLLSMFVMLVGMIPPLIDAVTEPRLGNIGRLWRHVLNDRQAQPLFESIDFLVRLMTPVSSSSWVNFLLVAVIFVVPWIKYLSGYERNLRTILSLSLFIGLYIVRGLHDLTYDYIVWFLLALTAAQLWLLISVLADWLRLPKIVFTSGSFAALVLVTWAYVPQSVQLGGECEWSGQKVTEWLSQRHVKRVRVQLIGRDAWGPGAAVINNLVRSKAEVCVDKRWGFMFGRDLSCTTEAEVGWTRILIAPPNKRDGHIIYRGGTFVVLEEAPTSDDAK